MDLQSILWNGFSMRRKSVALLSFAFFFSFSAQADKTDFSCSNRVVTIMLPTGKVEALKSKFEIISSLPFALQARKIGNSKSEVRVSYRWPRPEDQYPAIKNPEFFNRVVGIISPSEKDLAIEKISAEYIPASGC